MVKTKKSLGQNFFNKPELVSPIIDLLDLKPTDTVVEIGPGEGVFTKELLTREESKLDIYEIDSRLIKSLEKLSNDKTNIFNENFLDTDLSAYKNWKVFGAIPYYITSPIIHKLLAVKNRPDTIVLIIQKEVAEKIATVKEKPSYWSNIILGYDVKVEMLLPPDTFDPKPKIDSSVIKFNRLDENSKEVKFIRKLGFRKWEKFLHRVFKQPRKMISKQFDNQLLNKAGIKPTDRPHQIEPKKLMTLAEVC